MSDPLSIAGTAVGIISLGLQVCGEIVSFCQAWRGFNEDIQNISEKADAARMPLRTLRELIEDFHTTDPAIARDLENKARSIEQVIKRLKTATDRYATGTSNTESFRLQLKKAAYPFKKEALREIASDLESVQAMLQTALQIYSAQSNRALLRGIDRKLQEMNSKLSDPTKLPPSLLQSWCTQQEQLPTSRLPLQIAAQGDRMISNASIETNCNETCSSSCMTKATHETSIPSQNRNPASSAWTACARRPHKEVEVISISYYYRSRMLGFAIRASFLLTKGAGGHSIAPLLHLQPLVEITDSLALKIFSNFFICATSGDLRPLVDHTLQQLQQSFDLQEATPFDLIWVWDREMSLFDLAWLYSPGLLFGSGQFDHLSRFLSFLLNCGSKPKMKYYHGRSILDSLNGFALFGNECSLGLRLLDLGYSFTAHAPFSLADRQSILYLLSRTDESIQIPDIVRIIFRGSEHQLRDALKSGKASPSDIINGDSLIEYAFGWPKGIQILLEAGAARSPTCSDVSCIRYVEENDEEDTYHSVKLLIEAGCLFDWYDISRCEQNGRSSKIKLLLINELAARRKRLWHLAQSCLPAGQLPKLISDDENTGTTTIFDIHTAEIHDRLVKQGVSIDPSLRLNFSEIWYKSVYHFPEFTAQTLEELYQIGFRGITQVTPEGFMPLVIPRPRYYSTGSEHNEKWKGMERIAWLVSKGADPYQELPGTSATVTHHLGLTIVDYCLDALPGRREVKLENQKHYRAWKRMVSEFGKEFFLLPLVRDRCVCACSPDGCTTMSVTLRHIIDYIPAYRIHEPEFWYRELIQFLLCWTRGDTGIGWKVIRFLTFDALGLKHSCCINTPTYPFDFSFRLKSREEEEVEEILDEQKLGLIELEKILDELKIKFDELGQPVIEFLEGYWHTRMIEFLSQRDPYDEDHVIESRRMGVALEPDECVVPDRVSLLIGSKIMYEIST